MDENGTAPKTARRTWPKRIGLALGILLLGLVVFHRPILQTVVRRVAIHLADGQNLKLDLRVEGSVLGGIVLRNVHASAMGPSAVQSADIDLLRVDYSLWGYLRGGIAALLQDVELRNATVVLDPAKAPSIEPKKEQKFTLPAFFPDRLVLSDVNLRMVSQPQDLIIEHLALELLPNKPGELRIAKLQLASGKRWTNVTAQTTYENRNLYLRNLVLDDQTQLASVNIDASQIGQNKLAVGLHGTVAGGQIDTTLSLGGKGDSVQSNIDLNLRDTSLDAVRRYFQPAGSAPENDVVKKTAEVATKTIGAAATTVTGDKQKAEGAAKASESVPSGISGDVKQLVVKGSGTADQPRKWTGSIDGQIDNLSAGGVTFDHAKIDVKAANGHAQINDVELSRGANSITLQGSAELPENTSRFGRVPANIQLRGKLPDLGEITAAMPQPITGSAEINGQIKVANETVNADVALAGGPIDFGLGTAQKFVAKLKATKQMPPPDAQRSYYDGLASNVTFDVEDVRAKDYAVDGLHGELTSTGQQLNITQLLVRRAENQIALSGTYQLPQDFAKAAQQPATLNFSLDLPHLGAFWTGEALATGALQGSGSLNYQQQLGAGWFQLYGSNIVARNLTVQELSAQGTTANNVVYLNDLTASMNAHDVVRANGRFGIDPPYRYKGSLAANISDLAQFKPILAATGNKNDLAGSLTVDWNGSGQAANFNNSGELKMALEKGRYANLQGLQARVDATYAPDGLSVPLIFFGSDKMNFQAVGESNGNTLEISKIEIDQGKAKYATGYAAIPFIWKNVGTDKPVFDPNGKVAVTFQSENLDLKKLSEDVGAKPVGSGLLSIKLDAGGTLSDMTAQLVLQARELRSPAAPNFDPASFDLTAEMKNNQLTANGKITQSKIQPVAITASLPLNVGRILEEKKFDENTPLTAKINMPRSSVNFVRQFVPALERIDGDLALDVNVNGTIAKPVLSGSADTKINVARFSSATLPALTNFTARVAFTNDTLNLENFHGDLAGGPFTVTGRITFPKLTDPNFDLQLKAEAVLVARNDDMTVRADANVHVAGPLTSATVSGDVGLTNSQFLKNIDLIPIGLPGRPAPGPKPPSDTPDLSFPNPPLRDWKFDVAIKTKDPFVIRGNLANGDALVDMKLTGTGLQPKIEGSVRLQNVEATLPFSRLEVQQGFVYFNPSDPLNPGIDLQGTSLIRDYTVHVYVYGTVNEPQAIFSSEPPLPQEEIISLLATGTTKEELLSGGNVLAGRALMLLGQELYRKIFKKGGTTKPNSFFDKLSVDVGNVDPRTGQQTATARYRVNEKFQVIGDIGVQGDFRGTVKYVMRFR